MIKLHAKYKPLYTEDSRYFIVTGGRGSGKSFGVGLFAAHLSLEDQHRILYTRYTMTSAHLSVIPEFAEKLELLNIREHYHITKNDIQSLINRSAVVFRGIKTSTGNQTANLKSLQGVTTWICDEAEEMPLESEFDKIDLSIRQKGVHNRVIIILNPATKEHWIYKRFFEQMCVMEGYNGTKGNVTYIHTSYIDNIDNLDESFLSRIEQMRVAQPNKYQHVIMGGWLDRAEGVIFTRWKIGEMHPHLPKVYGMDFGFYPDPTTLIEMQIDKKNMKIYVRELLYRDRMSTSDIILEVSASTPKNAVIYADSAEPRLIDEMKSAGLNVEKAAKGADSVRATIMDLQAYEIIVTEDSINYVKELNNYRWHNTKAGIPIDAYNHCIDPTRYAFDGMKDAFEMSWA